MADKISAQDKVDINKAIENFSAEAQKLTKEQESQLALALHQQVLASISFAEGVQIVSSLTLDKVKADMESLSDEEKMQAYKDLNLK